MICILQYIRWDTIFAIVPICIACFGIIMTLTSIGILIKFADTPLVRASGRELCYVILGGILLCYLNTFILLAKPGIVVCALQRFSIGKSIEIFEWEYSVDCPLLKGNKAPHLKFERPNGKISKAKKKWPRSRIDASSFESSMKRFLQRFDLNQNKSKQMKINENQWLFWLFYN